LTEEIVSNGGKEMRTLSRALLNWFLVSASLLIIRSASAQVDVLTHRYDNTRSGINLNETVLNKSNVKQNKFGKLAFRIVDGNIYAQPLIVTQALVQNTTAQTATKDLVIVATEHNSVYAFDANDTSADPSGQESQKALWHTGPLGPNGLGRHIESNELYPKIGNAGCSDLTTEIGITSTPVIKLTKSTAPKEGVVFVVVKSKDGDGNFTYKLFTLELVSGRPLSNGVLIQGEISIGNKSIRFNPLFQLNRPALLLDQDVLYIAFGGHCDAGDYRGWIFAYDVSDPANPQKLDSFSTTFTERTSSMDDKEGRAGIWMSGHGLAAVGGNVYFVTGDGTYNVANPNFTELGNSVVKARLVSGKIKVQDWFAPQNRDDLKKFDTDLGSGGAVPVPNSHLLLAGGKEGRLYLLDRDDLGRGGKLSLQSFQVTNPPVKRVPTPTKAGDIFYWNIHGSPVIWPRQGEMSVYIMGEEDRLKQYRLVPDGTPAGWRFESNIPFKKSKESVAFPNPPNGLFNDPNRPMIWMPGGFLTLSANGNDGDTGIVWATMPFNGNANMEVVRGVLRAFDALDISKGQIWSSEESGNQNDRVGWFAKFNPPVVANGKVFVAAFQQERIDNHVHFKAEGGDRPALVIYGPK
jgi:hypothetical protein